MKREEMASGIDCEETELDRALEEIIEKEKASESSRNEGSSAQVKKDKEGAEAQSSGTTWSDNKTTGGSKW